MVEGPVRTGRADAAFLRFFATLNERQARLCAVERALALGRGGITRVAQVTGLTAKTIRKGIAELRAATPPAAVLPPGRSWRPGGGRKRVETGGAGAVAGRTGDRGGVHCGQSGRGPALNVELQGEGGGSAAGARVRRGAQCVSGGRLLREELDYHLQANRKDKEGRSPPERDAQFRYVNAQVQTFLERGQPVLSVDTQKKELVGAFKNGRRTWRPTGDPVRVSVYDFPSQAVGKALPYGVYDLGQNRGFVNVGTSGHQPRHARLRRGKPALVVDAGRRAALRGRRALLILVDSGGSNSARSRVWKVRLQQWADELQRPITVCHRAAVSGTKSNTGSSPPSPSTGVAGPWSTTTPS